MGWFRQDAVMGLAESPLGWMCVNGAEETKEFKGVSHLLSPQREQHKIVPSMMCRKVSGVFPLASSLT